MKSTASLPTPVPNSDASAVRVFRLPLGLRLLSIAAVIVLMAVTAIMSAFAVLVFASHWGLGLLMTACAGLFGALSGYCLRDLRGKLGLRVVFDADAVTLHLPAGRSLIHRPPGQQLTIPYTDIETIEARYEGYRSLGTALMQRAYVLRRKGGELVFLFEERALATRMASSFFTDIVAEIVARTHVPVRELGTVEGKGGILCAWGTEAPNWAAPPLPRDQALRLWRHAASTGSLVMSLILLFVIIRVLSKL